MSDVMSTDTAVTLLSTGSGKRLLLHERTISRTVTFFYCSKCAREKRFTWQDAYCTEAGELLCTICAPALAWDKDKIGWKLCRRCRRPRRTGLGPDTEFTWTRAYAPPAYVEYANHNTICNECRSLGSKRTEPLPLVCVRCGDTFTAKRSDAKYCSSRCRTATHRNGKLSANSRDGGAA